MGSLRRMLGALFGGASPKPEDIVFEPIDGPVRPEVAPKGAQDSNRELLPKPAAPLVSTSSASAERAVPEMIPSAAGLSSSGGLNASERRQAEAYAPVPAPVPRKEVASTRRVSLGELMPRVPAEWKRRTEWSPEQVLELPAESRLNVGAERPLAYSLRWLAKNYPRLFRDPSSSNPDTGVDLLMEPLKDPVASLEAIPAEIVGEAALERDTFSRWDEDGVSLRESAREARETSKALRAVRLPSNAGSPPDGFGEVLNQQDSLGSPASLPGGFLRDSSASVDTSFSQRPLRSEGVAGPAVQQGGANPRLKKILAAYAETLPDAEVTKASVESALSAMNSGQGQAAVSEKARALSGELTNSWLQAPAEAAGRRPKTVPYLVPDAARPAFETGGPPVLHQTRFEELGLSLSRFNEVRGFALWLGDHAMQTGELGFDTQAATARLRMEKILESAMLAQGVQDGFLSVTVNHARGAVSVFGGGPCMVAVAHQGEGIPSHLRSWLCGWVSQPLRG